MQSKIQSLDGVNELFECSSPQQIIAWTIESAQRPIISTSFGPSSATLLHMCTKIQPNIQVVWVDSGYNTNATYRFALRLIEELDLNIKIYTPASTSAFLNVKMKGVPDIKTPEHAYFTKTVKLEPFVRALNEINPDLWLTGIRRDETIYRATTKIAMRHDKTQLKIAPLLNWTQKDVNDYLFMHNLPSESDYFDPTKVIQGRECGLHTRL